MERYNYHFQIQKGWMNDPNGLIQYKGKYHIFYQYYPYDNVWGPMHWGHAVTTDFRSYTELEPALIPDQEYENDGGCFSGSAMEHNGDLYLFYTSVSKKYGQAQSLAISHDGIHFEKYEGNPVIKEYPSDGSKDFRDPKVFRYKDGYRMVLGSFKNNQGKALLYKSEDLIHWEYLGVLYEPEGYAYPMECPDLFFLDGHWVFMYSRIGRDTKAVAFVQGSFDGIHFIPEKVTENEIGPDFYAPQTFMDEKGRRISIGWFYNWKKERNEAPARGGLTVPRELSIHDEILYVKPLDEVSIFGRRLPLSEKKNLSSISGIELYASEEEVRLNSCVHSGKIRSVTVFEDIKGAEVFINGGEAVLTYTK